MARRRVRYFTGIRNNGLCHDLVSIRSKPKNPMMRGYREHKDKAAAKKFCKAWNSGEAWGDFGDDVWGREA